MPEALRTVPAGPFPPRGRTSRPGPIGDPRRYGAFPDARTSCRTLLVRARFFQGLGKEEVEEDSVGEGEAAVCRTGEEPAVGEEIFQEGPDFLVLQVQLAGMFLREVED